jgi:D-isomer specific 2-hydroxyacid dehydrogenase, NAD binding domain
MRPGTRPTGPADRRGDGRGWWWARSRAGQAAGTGRPGGGSAARPSAARSRRTAWGSVTAPRIRRGPPQLHARQLRGKLVGLVGLGAIGRQVAKRLQAFDTGSATSTFDGRRRLRSRRWAFGSRSSTASTPRSTSSAFTCPTRRPPGACCRESASGGSGPGRSSSTRREARSSTRSRSPRPSSPDGWGARDWTSSAGSRRPPLLGVRVPGLVLAPHVAGSVFDNVGNVARHVFRNIQRVLDGQPLPPADLVALDAGD